MLEIAHTENARGIFQKDIAVKQSLSIKYLDQIIYALKSSGLIRNVKGKKSGYVLARSADDITLLDIYRAFEPTICLVECLSVNHSCKMSENCHARGFWGELNILIANYFRSTTLSDLLKQRVEDRDYTIPV